MSTPTPSTPTPSTPTTGHDKGDPRHLVQAVALGGGHGLAATLKALRLFTPDITAIVTVADDGGSSGRLRRELGVLPPGDLRQALAALCGKDALGQQWRHTLQHRFSANGHLQGHALGNLLLLALFEQAKGDAVQALDLAGHLLGISGRVLPACPHPLTIGAYIRGHDPALPQLLSIVRGQVAIALSSGRKERLFVEPDRPPACAEAVQAIGEADVVILGPGSWFSSVVPHLLVPELAQAIRCSPAKKYVTLNLCEQVGETDAFAPQTYLDVLAAHAPHVRWDAVIVDPSVVTDLEGLQASAARLGAQVVLSRVALTQGPEAGQVHDPVLLSQTFHRLLEVADTP